MIVRDLRRLLERLQRETGEPKAIRELRRVLEAALTFADAHDDMSVQDLIRKLTGAGQTNQAPPPAQPDAALVSDIVARLKDAFRDDRAFEREMNEIARMRKATKSALTRVFFALFNRTQGVPKSATRADLLQLIADERHILVRNERMDERLRGGKIVPAE
jgi:hypothetical protein